MKIVICGSIAFYPKMLAVKENLETLGHEVILPPTEVKDESGNFISVEKYYEIRKTAGDEEKWVWDRKSELVHNYFTEIKESDVILVLNHDKNGVVGYIGGNTLMEMGIAFFLNKKIFLLNLVPDIAYKEEILAMRPIVIDGDLSKII